MNIEDQIIPQWRTYSRNKNPYLITKSRTVPRNTTLQIWRSISSAPELLRPSVPISVLVIRVLTPVIILSFFDTQLSSRAKRSATDSSFPPTVNLEVQFCNSNFYFEGTKHVRYGATVLASLSDARCACFGDSYKQTIASVIEAISFHHCVDSIATLKI